MSGGSLILANSLPQRVQLAWNSKQRLLTRRNVSVKNYKQFESNIGFADSEFIDFSKTKDKVVVRIKTWDEKLLLFQFEEAIGICGLNAFQINDIVESTSTGFLEKCIGREYERYPENHPYRSYSFLDPNEDVVIEIISRGILIQVDAGS